jgi:alpha-galactosidase
VRDDGAEEIWARPLVGGAKAVIFLNRGDAQVRIKVTWQELGWPAQPAAVRDLWIKRDMGVFRESYFAEVASHGVVMLRLMPVPVAVR